MKSFRKTRRIRKHTGGRLYEEESKTEEMEVEEPTISQGKPNDDSVMSALLAYSNTGRSVSPLDSNNMSTSPISNSIVTQGGSRRHKKRTGGYKDSDLNLNTNIPAFGAPLTREQIEMLRAAPAPMPMPMPTTFQYGNTNDTRTAPSNTSNAAAGGEKKSRRKRKTRKTRRTRRSKK